MYIQRSRFLEQICTDYTTILCLSPPSTFMGPLPSNSSQMRHHHPNGMTFDSHTLDIKCGEFIIPIPALVPTNGKYISFIRAECEWVSVLWRSTSRIQMSTQGQIWIVNLRQVSRKENVKAKATLGVRTRSSYHRASHLPRAIYFQTC